MPPTRPFRFAVQGWPAGSAAMAGVADHARHVESLGYDDFYTMDHVGLVDPFVPLVVAAGATDRLRVGPLVVNNELHHPALLARTAATVDAATDGRLILGMGTGYMESEHEAIDVPIRAPGQRVARFEESLVVLRALLDTGAADFDGEHHHVHLDYIGIRPTQHRVPFLIGGHGPRVVAIAARHADIFQFTGLTHGVGGVPSVAGFGLADVQQRAEWLTEAADSAGRGVDEIERSVLVQFAHVGAVAPSVDDVAERFELPAAVVDETPFVLFGSLDQVIDELHRLRERLGVSHVVVRDPDGFAPVVDALRGR